MGKYKYPDKTTVWLKRSTVEALQEIGRKNESYDDVVKRLLGAAQGEVDVFVDVISVDGDNPQRHSLILQLGEFVYKWENGKFNFLRRITSRPEHKISVGT